MKELRDRTLDFAARILEISERLPDSGPARVVRDQLCSSGTAIGAWFEQEDTAQARREAVKTRYWLRLVGRKWKNTMNVVEELQEVEELIKILTSR